MANFEYKGKKNTGESVTGVYDAKDKFELARILRADGITVVSTTELKAGNHESFWVKFSRRFSRVSLEERIFFASNLSAMLSAGLSISRALAVLTKQVKNEAFKSVLFSLTEDIAKGSALSISMEKHRDIFPPVFIAMVGAGEASGKLPEALGLVGDQLNKTYATRKKIIGALIYPGVILSATVLIGALMMIFIVPTLSATFKDLKIELPLSTRIVIGTSDFVANNVIAALGLAAAGVYAGYMLVRTPRGKRAIDWFSIHAPLIGSVVRNMNAAVTARTLSSLVSSGVDIVSALDTTKKVVQNSYYREVLDKAGVAIQKGSTLASVFEAETKLYPVLVGEMVDVGEETGKLPEMLLRVATFYEEQVDAVTKDMTTIIEPVLMILIGATVGFFAISMIQPIYGIGESIG